MNAEREALIDWLVSGETGISSLTIVHVMEGVNEPNFGASTPRDVGDFARCEGLLAARPDYRARLGEVAERYPEWRPLVQAWPTSSQLHQKGNQGLQEAMVALQKEVNRIHLENA